MVYEYVQKREETSINLIKSNIIIVRIYTQFDANEEETHGRRSKEMMIKNKISLNYPLTILLLYYCFFFHSTAIRCVYTFSSIVSEIGRKLQTNAVADYFSLLLLLLLLRVSK